MHDYEVEKALDSITLLVDTREQMTDRLKDRLELAGLPYERQKLDYGDYSAKCDALDLSKDVTLGEILKRELANVKGLKWEMKINTKDKEDFYLQVSGRNKVPVGNKYERIIGLPTHYVDYHYRVGSDTVKEYISKKTFPDVEWETVSVEEIDRRLKEFHFLYLVP